MNKLHLNRAAIGAACIALALAGQPALSASAQSSNIVVKPLSATYANLEALKTSVTTRLDGQDSKKQKLAGEMQVVIAYNAPKKMSLMEMGGSLIPIVMGASLPMPGMTSFGVYSTGKDAFLLMGGKQTTCTKMPASVIDSLANDNPTDVMGLSNITKNIEQLSRDKKLNGSKVGDERVNGIATTRYVLDAATLKVIVDAEQKSAGAQSGNKISYTQGDLWLARDGSYIVQFKFDGAGEMKRFEDSALDGFKGKVSALFNLSEINNAKFEVKPPMVCTQ
jgi:hypothetical protein